MDILNFTADDMASIASDAPAQWSFVMNLIYRNATLGFSQCVIGIDEVGPHHKKLELRGFRLTVSPDQEGCYLVSWPAKPKVEIVT